MVSCQKGPTRHAYAWQIGPFWQDNLDILIRTNRNMENLNSRHRLDASMLMQNVGGFWGAATAHHGQCEHAVRKVCKYLMERVGGMSVLTNAISSHMAIIVKPPLEWIRGDSWKTHIRPSSSLCFGSIYWLSYREATHTNIIRSADYQTLYSKVIIGCTNPCIWIVLFLSPRISWFHGYRIMECTFCVAKVQIYQWAPIMLFAYQTNKCIAM